MVLSHLDLWLVKNKLFMKMDVFKFYNQKRNFKAKTVKIKLFFVLLNFQIIYNF